MKIIKVVAAIIEKEEKILIARRLKGEFAGLWEFPGGKYEEGETGEQAIKREIEEEFDVEISVNKYLCTIEHDYSSFHLIMDCFVCSLYSDKMVLHDHSDIKWIDPFDINVDWVPADIKVIKEYEKHLQTRI